MSDEQRRAAREAVAFAAGLVALLVFSPYAEAVDRVAQLLGDDPAAGDLSRTGQVLLALSVALGLYVVYLLMTRRGRGAAQVVPQTCSVDDVVADLVASLDAVDRVTVVGYSLSFAEPLRLALEAGGRRALTVHLGVPTAEYLRAHVDEGGRPVDRRVDKLDDRLDEWRELQATSRVDQVVVTRQDVPPHLFAVAFGTALYVGRYPFVHQGGKHVLRKNLDRHMVRVDAATSPVLCDLLRQQVECRVS